MYVKSHQVILFSAGFTHLDFRTTVRWCGGGDGGGGFAGGRTGIESHNGWWTGLGRAIARRPLVIFTANHFHPTWQLAIVLAPHPQENKKPHQTRVMTSQNSLPRERTPQRPFHVRAGSNGVADFNVKCGGERKETTCWFRCLPPFPLSPCARRHYAWLTS